MARRAGSAVERTRAPRGSGARRLRACERGRARVGLCVLNVDVECGPAAHARSLRCTRPQSPLHATVSLERRFRDASALIAMSCCAARTSEQAAAIHASPAWPAQRRARRRAAEAGGSHALRQLKSEESEEPAERLSARRPAGRRQRMVAQDRAGTEVVARRFFSGHCSTSAGRYSGQGHLGHRPARRLRGRLISVTPFCAVSGLTLFLWLGFAPSAVLYRVPFRGPRI
jgi:predicted secreted protein